MLVNSPSTAAVVSMARDWMTIWTAGQYLGVSDLKRDKYLVLDEPEQQQQSTHQSVHNSK